MKTIYLFSGLGADERVFRSMNFPDYHIVFIQWMVPEEKETIEAYAQRLTYQVTTEKPIFIGLSFGGIIAGEIARLITVEKLILLASAKTKYELPGYYRLAGRLSLHKLLPSKALTKSGSIANWFFGTEGREEKRLLKSILEDTNPVFLKWAIDKIVHWKNETTVANTIHIHGTSDRILPLRNIHGAIKVKNGGHFMTVNKAAELSELIQGVLT